MRNHSRTAAVAAVASLVLLPAVVATGASAGAASPSSSRPAASGHAPALWYFAHNESLELRTKAGVTKTLAPRFTSFDNPQWSAGQKRLTYTTSTSGSAIAVKTVTATGTPVDSFTCGCAGPAVWRGRSLLALREHRLLIRNPRSHRTRQVTMTGAHFVNGGPITSDPRALVATPSGLLFSAATHKGTSAYGGPETVFLATPKGKVSKLHAAGGNTVVGLATINASGTDVAYLTEAHGGFCADYPLISILNLRTGSVRRPHLPHLNRPWALLSLRYRGNRLFAGLAPTPSKCASGSTTATQRVTPTLYRVTAKHLVRPARGVVDKALARHWTALATGKVTVDGAGGYRGSTLRITGGPHAITVATRAFGFGWL